MNNELITIQRLTKDGNPFTLTGVRGSEKPETGCLPTLNFFVQDSDGNFYYEHEFGELNKPFKHYQVYQTKGKFNLYDCNQFPNIFRELGRKEAINKLISEGYEGFYNSMDMAKMFRNRISLFDIPSVREKIK